MTKIKICGLSRPCDIEAVNEAKPDFAGFIVNFPKSRRNVTIDKLKELRSLLSPDIVPVGVFVNEAPEVVASLLNDGTLGVAQLHGSEDDDYIRTLRTLTGGVLWKAYSVHEKADVERACKSPADMILLDHGAGGTGKTFPWELVSGIDRPWFLAGGIGADNALDAIKALHPYGIDLSSSVETDGFKDREKILGITKMIRKGMVQQ